MAASIQERLATLERIVAAAMVAPDAFASKVGQNVSSSGVVTYDFHGHVSATGLDLPRSPSGVPADEDKVRWLDADESMETYLAAIRDTANKVLTLEGWAILGTAGWTSQALLAAQAIGESAQLYVLATQTRGSLEIEVTQQPRKTIFDSSGVSDFLQLDSTRQEVAGVNAIFLPGDIKPTARATAPEGWVMCEGQAISRTTFAALFSAIGTTYGAGNGSTTFNVPDLRGRVPVGVDGGAGRVTANNKLGQASGEQAHALTNAELAAHTHSLANAGAEAFVHVGSGTIEVHLPTMGAGATGSDGSGTAHNNLQPYQVVGYMVKT